MEDCIMSNMDNSTFLKGLGVGMVVWAPRWAGRPQRQVRRQKGLGPRPEIHGRRGENVTDILGF
jgi:hypothetical protein